MAKRKVPLERWKAIPGYEGYQVSDHGHVRSVDRKVLAKNRWGDLRYRRYPGRVLKPGFSPYGYAHVQLGRRYSRDIHWLVMLAFVGPCPHGKEVAHWDGNPANNRLSNLRYATKRQNRQDCLRHGRAPLGELRWNARLTVKDVIKIRKSGEHFRKLAVKYGVSPITIHDVINRRRWKWVE